MTMASLGAVAQMTTALLADPSFTTACPGGVFTAVPQSEQFPYALILTRESPGDLETFGKLAVHVEQRVRVFSQYQGTLELDAIAAVAKTLLYHASASLSGWIVHLINYVGALLPVEVVVGGVVTRYRDVVFDWLVEAA